MASPTEVMTVAKNHFETFGTTAAQRLIERARQLPPDMSLDAMKAAMDKLSPTTYARAEMYTQKARDAGANAADALHIGVARALSETLLSGLQDVGEKHIRKNGLGLLKHPITGATSIWSSGRATPIVSTPLQPMLKIGPWVYPKSTTEEMIQIQGQYPSPQWSIHGQGVGIYANINGNDQPMVQKLSNGTSVISGDWGITIAEVLSHDCDFPKDCITSSMTDATAGHRYGALRDFIPQIGNQINKDFVGLISSDGEGGSDSNKEPDNPVIATSHPITGETWGIYMYLAVPNGGKSWGGPDNPVALLLKFKKVADCGDFLTPQNVATVAALTFATGGMYGFLSGLGIISLCYIWQFIKVVVAVIVDVAEAIAAAVTDVACALTSIPNLGTAVTKTGVQTKNAAATAVGVGLTVAGALCGNSSCPATQVPVPGGCGCMAGSTLTNVNGQMICVIDTPWYSNPITLIGLAVVGILGFAVLSNNSPKTASAAA